jgi:8-oxo-dGTP diphosphatase
MVTYLRTMGNADQESYPPHVAAVTGIVTDGLNCVLLINGHRRGWEPPGGQVELGEDLVAPSSGRSGRRAA